MPSPCLPRITREQRAAEVARAREGAAWVAEMAEEVSAAELDPTQKQAVWAHLKQQHPERVAFLSDPVTRALMQATGAVPTFPRALVRAALQPNQR